MASLRNYPSSRKTQSIQTRRLFIGITLIKRALGPGSERCQGKTLVVIEIAERDQNIPATWSASAWRIIGSAISSSTSMAACDTQLEFDYGGQKRSCRRVTRRLERTNAVKLNFPHPGRSCSGIFRPALSERGSTGSIRLLPSPFFPRNSLPVPGGRRLIARDS